MPMPLDEKKRGSIVSIIAGKLKQPSSSEEFKEAKVKDGAEQDYSDGLSQAADEILQAFKSGDVNSLKSGLKSFISMCMDESSEE